MRIRWSARNRGRTTLRWGIPALAAAALALALAQRPDLAPACGFREAAGLPCATCGGGRAAAALASLRIREAFLANPLVALGLLGLWSAGAGVAAGAALGFPLPRLHGRPGRRLIAALVALWVLNWLYLLARRG